MKPLCCLQFLLVEKKTNPINTTSKFYKIYEEHNDYTGEFSPIESIYEILNSNGNGYYSTGERLYKKSTGILKFSKAKENTWALLSEDEAMWVSQIEKKSKSFVKDHFNVRVGIKSTADKVFISDKWDDLNGDKPEDDLLKDLISQENIKPWAINNALKIKVLYPHFARDGKKETIDIKQYPKANAYFLCHEEKLKERKYLIDAGRNWYELWVPQNPHLWRFPKLIFPDISPIPRFYYDISGKIVNGNCYWIVAEKEKDTDKLLLIQGIANSKLMTKYHDLVFNNKLYSGRRRYFAQYLENYPLPDLTSLESKKIIETVKHINGVPESSNISNLIGELEIMVAKAYGVNPVLTNHD